MCGNTVRVNKNYEAIILFWTNSSIARYIISVLVQNLGDKNVKATQDDAVVQTVTNIIIILSFRLTIILYRVVPILYVKRTRDDHTRKYYNA